MAISKEVKVGLLALAAGAVLYIGFNFLKGVDFLSPTKSYYVLYQNVDGLTTSNPVMLNGLNVGQVDNIKILHNRGNKILVVINVDKNILLGDSTQAFLANTDILGSKGINLKIGNNTKLFDGKDTLIGIKEQAMSELISEKALPIMSNLDSTVIKLNALFGDQMGVSVKNILHNFEIASNDLKLMVNENRSNMGKITSNLNQLSGSLTETERSFKPLIAKLSNLADTLNDLELKKLIDNATLSMKNLENVTSKINKGEGSLGLMVNDKAVYDNLNASVKDLDELLIDVKKNPKRYVTISVFGGGKKDKESKKKKNADSQTSPAVLPQK